MCIDKSASIWESTSFPTKKSGLRLPSGHGNHVVDALGGFAHLAELAQSHLHRRPAGAARLRRLRRAAGLGAAGRWHLGMGTEALRMVVFSSKNGILTAKMTV